MGALVGGNFDMTLKRATNKDPETGRSRDYEEGHYEGVDECNAKWVRCGETKGDDGTKYDYLPDTIRYCTMALDAGTSSSGKMISAAKIVNINLGKDASILFV